MLERSLFDHYRLYAENVMHAYELTVIEAGGETYLLMPVPSDQSRVQGQSEMAQWLRSQGEEGVPELVRTDHGKSFVDIDGTTMALYHLPAAGQLREASELSPGKKLAVFHQRGMYYPSAGNRKGENGAQYWKGKWEKRLDQMESWYTHIRNERFKSPFDESFLITYSYFMGMSENAIQLMNDIGMDDGYAAMDQGNTICHRRFREGTWLTVDHRYPSAIKVPGEFVYDHFSRDLTERFREAVQNAVSLQRQTDFYTFLADYEQERPLTAVDRKLMVARLMFPVHYFDTVENYYQTVDEKKKQMYADEFIMIQNGSDFYEKRVAELQHYLLDERTRMRMPVWIG
ncbi:spore coat putative kinase YutH [Alteribacter natronophilus]|uniref:spore coat putative kinase YutH n=1 Tax=Alteribacter natronophilus TaxID=2583810 RepID=UPI00110F31F2|nr:spore coat protein YutH [Alteribacter natronophilus]TMW72488.1 spore coat protein YutH [Alteribacter natronophilus]